MIRIVNNDNTYFSSCCKDRMIICMKRLARCQYSVAGTDSWKMIRPAQVTQVFLLWPCSLVLSLRPGFHSGLSRKGRSVSWKISLTPIPHSIQSYFPTDSRTKRPDEEEEETSSRGRSQNLGSQKVRWGRSLKPEGSRQGLLPHPSPSVAGSLALKRIQS